MNSKETRFEKDIREAVSKGYSADMLEKDCDDIVELSVKLANITKSLTDNPGVGIAALAAAAGGLIGEQFTAINIKKVTELMCQLLAVTAIGEATEPLTQNPQSGKTQ